MSEPKRYFLKISPTISGLRADVYEAENGEFVYYDDYAALAADKEAETKATFDAIRLITQLRDENERLRKAGDVMAAIIRPPAHGPGEWDGEYDAWQIAKEVQS